MRVSFSPEPPRRIDMQLLIQSRHIQDLIRDKFIMHNPWSPLFFCPFHQDTKPSLSIYRNGFFCFGCRTHGDAIDFLRRLTGVSFDEVTQIIDAAITELPKLLEYDEAPSLGRIAERKAVYELPPYKERFIWWSGMLRDRPFGKWQLIPDTPEARQWAISRGAGFFTVLQVDRPTTPCWYFGPWYIDLDGSAEQTSEDLTKLLGVLDSKQVAVWDTGGKGYHVLVDIKGAGPTLPLLYARMTASLGLATSDQAVYNLGKGRLWRIEGVRRMNGKKKRRIL